MKLPKVPASEDATGATPPPPKTVWDKIITSTPVVMTVLATILAGLSSSEMSQAQYYRSLSAQHQSKASDQWAFFQAKKIRSTDVQGTLTLLRGNGDVASLTPEELASTAADVAGKLQASAGGNAAAIEAARKAAAELEAVAGLPEAESALAGMLPAFEPKPIPSDAVRRAVEALRRNSTDTVDPSFFFGLREADLRTAFAVTEENVAVVNDSTNPQGKAFDRIEAALNGLARAVAMTRRKATSGPATTTTTMTTTKAATAETTATDRAAPIAIRQVANDVIAARQRFDAARLSREAEMNQTVAYLYDVEVMRSSIESERHRTRSRYFFFGMLGAQAATTIATVALAARERSTLWTLAAGIGVLAMAYAAYVYLFT